MAASCARQVHSLQDLCFGIIYKDLICKATSTTSSFIGNLIDEQLWGKVKKDVRDKCIVKLNEYHFMEEPIDDYATCMGDFTFLDVCAVLDCVLDEHITALEIHIPYPVINIYAKIMSTIACRSPKLKELSIFFRNTFDSDDCITNPNMNSDDPSKSMSSLFLQLANLTLDLYTGYDCDDQVHLNGILSIVGECCPALTELVVLGFRYSQQDILGLILGKLATELFSSDENQWADETVLETLSVTPEFLSPACFTLENLRLFCPCERNFCQCYISVSTYAFALRHLFKLQRIQILEDEFSVYMIPMQAINILHSGRNMEGQQVAFNEACREAATRIALERNLITSTTTLSSSLSLTYLDVPLQIDQLDILRAIGNICPNLKSIRIIRGETMDTFNHSYVPENHSEHSPLHDEITTILERWPKVECIGFSGVTCDSCVRSILNALGSTLEVLQFNFCSNINLANLVPCAELEHLSIAGPSIELNLGARSPSDVNADTFLPRLKTFKSEICLGSWSPMFESKPSLTELALFCCHIGTRVITPRLKWSEVPDFWSNLQTLELRQCSGITMTMLSQLIPRLKKLRSVKLPVSIMEREPELTPEILRNSLKRDEPFEMGVSDSSSMCQFQLP